MNVTVAVKKVGNHANSCCDVASTGLAGMIMADVTTIVTNPVKIPAAKKGIKYFTKFREYKLKVCVNISPMESSLWRFFLSTNLSSVCRYVVRAY
jgi:hypothetical protein